MIYRFFAFSMLFSFGYAALNGELTECVNAILDGVGNAVSLSIALAGMLCFWNGIVCVIKESRFLDMLSRLLSPITGFLFQKSVSDAELRRSTSLFISANALGLGNAATPIALGIMRSLDDGKDKASDDMVMLCMISTAPVSLIPTTIMTILSQGGCHDPTVVIRYVWLASLISFILAVIVGKSYCTIRKRR